MNIFLIGYMGSGKSSLGKRLANRLQYEFIDLDNVIERLENRTINEIFSDLGESKFREIESNWIQNFENDNTVISLGGGTPCFNDNLQTIGKKGLTVYLKVSDKSLCYRLQNAKNERPLISEFKNDSEKLLKFIQKNVAKREEYYLQSNIHFDAENMSSEKLDRLIDLIKLSH